MIVMYSLKKYTKEYKEHLDDIGFYIQKIGGEFSVARHDVEFTFEDKYKDFVLIQFPFLREIPLCY
jgi:uncharacterized protein (DUF1330 family)